jgi:putative RecB family exonuclease
MSLPLPTALSPSKVASFKDCALAFRFSAIDRLPEPPSPWAAKGTLVHRVLELLHWRPAGQRSLEAALADFERAAAEVLAHPEYAGLDDDPGTRAEVVTEAERLVHRYFELEDPNRVNAIGLEVRLEARLGTLTLRGVIDRLELTAEGGLVVTDYKTGSPPGLRYEQSRLGGVHFYAFLCESVLGRRPDRIQLLYLGEPLSIIAEPSDRSVRGLQQRATAIWTAIERACQNDDFRPRPSPLCDWCAFQAYCPAFGGDPARASELAAAAPAAAAP